MDIGKRTSERKTLVQVANENKIEEMGSRLEKVENLLQVVLSKLD